MLALLATISAPFPFILYKYGPKIRANSEFASANLAKEAGAVSGGKEMRAESGHAGSEGTRPSGEATAVHSREPSHEDSAAAKHKTVV